jgi:hypothetical protein
MAEETGIQPSLTDEDVKAYLEQVLKEVKKPQGPNNGNNV